MTRTLAALALALALVMAAGAPGCARKHERDRHGAEDAVDPALAAYVQRLVALEPNETAAMEAVIAHSGPKYTDDQTLLSALRDPALPRYREFVADLKALPTPEGRLRELHGRLTRLAAEELALLERLEVALERGDGTAVLFINREHARVRAEMDAFLGELRPATARPASAGAEHGLGEAALAR